MHGSYAESVASSAQSDLRATPSVKSQYNPISPSCIQYSSNIGETVVNVLADPVLNYPHKTNYKTDYELIQSIRYRSTVHYLMQTA